jgi:uncharacterized membrane protein YfcA
VAGFLVGFFIAASIGMIGFGAGTMGTPLLILVLRMKGAAAVGTALAFVTIVNLIVAPVYLMRRQVDFETLAWMLAGGLPGVIIGGRVLIGMAHSINQHLLFIFLGVTVVLAAFFNVMKLLRDYPDRRTGNSRWLGALMFPVGLEMGFSSAGSGALGSSALLGLTRLEGATIVGTGVSFSLALSAVGSGMQISAGNYDAKVLEQLLAGGVIGALCGSMLAARIPSRPLKWVLSVWLAVLGVQLFLHGLSV